MISAPGFEFPAAERRVQRRAIVLEWITLAYMLSAVTLLFLVMGSSQALKVTLAEDLLCMIPAIAFLISSKLSTRAPNERFPYGYHRATSLAFLCAALALLAFGLFLFIESVIKLAQQEHPPIGTLEVFGRHVWLGWPMIAALLYSGVPAALLGRAKIPLAKAIHDKTLYADAVMNKDDMLTAGAGVVGILGVGFGLWWADALAGAVISLGVVRDGYSNLREVAKNLTDRQPKTTDHARYDELPDRVRALFASLPWVRAADVRMREEGHVYFGEVFVVPKDERDITQRIQDAIKRAKAIDWRVHDLVVTPVPRLAGDGR